MSVSRGCTSGPLGLLRGLLPWDSLFGNTELYLCVLPFALPVSFSGMIPSLLLWAPRPHPSICHTRRNTKILSQQSCLKAPLPRLQVRDRQLPTPPACQTSSQNVNVFLQNPLSVSLFSVPQPLCLYRLRSVVNSGGKWFICHLLFCKSCTRRTSKCRTCFLHASTKSVIGNLNVLLNLLSSPFNLQDHL